MNTIAKIRAEIERLKGQLIRGACAAQIEMETNCKDEAYNELLSFLSNLESEKPKSTDLEELGYEETEKEPETSPWIPANIPPKEGRWVFVCSDDGTPQCIGCAIYEDGVWKDSDEDRRIDPDYWMPVPPFGKNKEQFVCEELEEEVKNYFQGYFPGTETAEQCNTDLHFTPPAIIRLARHFAQWGVEHLKK